MPTWVDAFLWGLLAGSTLVVGAAIAWWFRVPRLVVALVMAFGAGVLVSALAFDLVEEALDLGGVTVTAAGCLAGAATFTAANALLARRGARHRKRSGQQQATQSQVPGSGAAIALGALLDGVPESVVLGVGLLEGSGVSTAVLVAVAVSNLPEGLSSAAGMKQAGRGAGYVFGVWGGIACASGVAAALGFALSDGLGDATLAVVTAVAAGAILAMVADTMIPEAFERAHLLTGLVTAVGFVTAFAVHELGA